MKTNAKRSTVIEAIEKINNDHGYKIILNKDEIQGKWFYFTIRSEVSGIPGARNSCSGRKLVSASWHSHGYLFDEIFEIEPDALIYSGGEKITKQYGNWQDRNIGSHYQPCYFSETSIL
jgi:hypothetical protein